MPNSNLDLSIQLDPGLRWIHNKTRISEFATDLLPPLHLTLRQFGVKKTNAKVAVRHRGYFSSAEVAMDSEHTESVFL